MPAEQDDTYTCLTCGYPTHEDPDYEGKPRPCVYGEKRAAHCQAARLWATNIARSLKQGQVLTPLGLPVGYSAVCDG